MFLSYPHPRIEVLRPCAYRHVHHTAQSSVPHVTLGEYVTSSCSIPLWRNSASHRLCMESNKKGHKSVVFFVQASLKRMQIDYADIVFAHRPDVDTPMVPASTVCQMRFTLLCSNVL